MSMALVSVTGGKKTQRLLAQDTAYWAIYELMHGNMANNIEVDISITNLWEREELIGVCCWSEDNIRPRVFEIEIDKNIDDDELIKTVCHEIVHVKQYAKGELRERYAPKHDLFWKSRKANGYKYDNQPWELEAWRLQEVLFRKYINE
tara:strand:- start:537 stop:980 length:444 start_codon:yes stop_codon:yes gene_type:complete